MSRAAASKSPLPLPSPEALERQTKLSAQICSEIDDAGGALSFLRYMALALYQPELGYYSASGSIFGPQGDFVTAPEYSPLFAHCLARQCQQVLEVTGGGDILEFGAGSGVLAVELMLDLERLDCLPQRYFILELSAELRAQQEALLARRAGHLLSRVKWLSTLPSRPLRGVVLANEVLDAMPVRLFTISDGLIQERAVGYEAQHFVWRNIPADIALEAAVADLFRDLDMPWPAHYSSELSPMLSGWIASLADVIECGVALLIDYGYSRREYYLPERNQGTLLCHYRQRVHDDPLMLSGLQDITAHVDFTTVAKAGLAAGLDLAGYTTQAHFVLATGLTELAAASNPENIVEHLALSRQIKTLTLPGEMGERFKVLALARGVEVPLRGFALRDLRNRL